MQKLRFVPPKRNKRIVTAWTMTVIVSLFITLSLSVTTSIANPSTVVVPNSLENVEGWGGSYAFSLEFINRDSMRYQQVYDSAEFSSFNGPHVITKIAFRPDGYSGSNFIAEIPNIQINLSTTPREPDHLGGHFANVVGADDTVVYSGPLPLSSSNIGPFGGPKAFDIVINLMNPFIYNPSRGNLLLDVRSYTGALTTLFDGHRELGDSISVLLSSPASGKTNGVYDPNGDFHSSGLVTQFTLEPLPALPLLGVQIDILPGFEPNCFNSNGQGVIPVAVLGSDTFDVSTIDPFTLALDGADVRVKGKSESAGSIEDVNNDGFLDLVVEILDEADYVAGDTVATLTGRTDIFSIEGTDTICIRPQ